ncbi:DNA-directed RNA polymerase subunit delta [Pseudoneobacillus sp. C159]
MSLAQFTKEQLEDMSLIDMAYVIIEGNNKETVAFMDLMNQIIAATGMSESEVRAKISQFYTDMNIDGRFLCLGDNRWGLRTWYKVEKSEEDTITDIKPKKGKKKKLKGDEDDIDADGFDDEEDLFEEDFDEFEDEDLLEDEDDLLDDLDEDEVEEDFEDEEILEDDEEVFDELDEVDDELEEEDEEDDDLALEDEDEDL